MRLTQFFAFTALGGCCLLAGVSATAQEQMRQDSKVGAVATTASRPVVVSVLPWSQLSAQQKQSLAPLAQSWSSLSDGQRRKWVALSESYPRMSAAEQSVLHSRMVEWAALKPHERELARLNFAQTKKLPAADRTANWEAYQALSPEDKKKYVTAQPQKPAGAAVAIKPVPTEKLASSPVIRNAPDARKAMSEGSQSINRTTLLPVVEKPAPESSAASTTSN